MVAFLRRRAPLLCGLVFAFGLLFYSTACVLAGANPAGFVLYGLAALLLLVAPGLLLARLLLPGAAPADRVVAAFPLGGLLLMLCFVLFGRVLPLWCVAVLPLALGMYCLYSLWRGGALRRLRAFKPALPHWLLLAFFGAGLVLFAFIGVLATAKPANVGNMVYSQDLLWSVGNAAAVGYGSPLRDIRAAGGVLHYHYLPDALAGLLGYFSGQSAWDAVCYLNWPLWAGALLLGLYRVGGYLGGSRWAALGAPFAVFFMGSLWAESMLHLYRNMNGVLQGNVLLVALLVVLCCLPGLRGRGAALRGALALGFSCAALVWSKSTLGVLVLCALAAALVVGGLSKKKLNLPLLGGGAFGALGFLALYGLIYSGAINNLVYAPWAAAPGMVFTILAWFLPVTLLYLVALGLALRRFGRLSYTALVLHALVPGGILAYCLYNHYSYSQSYFLLAAGFAMCLLAVPALRWLAGKQPGRVITGLLVAGALCATVVGMAPELRLGVQVGLRSIGVRPSYEWRIDSITTDDEAAAAYLRQNMTDTDVFATNRNAQLPQVGEGVFHYYTAASGRQAFVESWRYAMDYSIDYFLLLHNLETVSDGIFAATTYEEAVALARENGIGYLLLHLPTGGALFQGGEAVFASETVIIYKV